MSDKSVPQAFKIPSLTPHEVMAIRALEAGEADPHQQRMALDCILKKICRTYDQHFVPGSDRETVFLEGRGFVGQNLLKFMRLEPAALKAVYEEEAKDVRRSK